MDDIWMRIVESLTDRVSGPMKLRMLLQPFMATVFAVVAGLKDARTGKPPYFWAMFTDPVHRVDMIRDGWQSIGKLFLLAMALDVVYQVIVRRFVYPGEVIIVASLLAILPYLVLRGLVNVLPAKYEALTLHR